MKKSSKTKAAQIIAIVFILAVFAYNIYANLQTSVYTSVSQGDGISRLTVHYLDVGQGDSVLLCSNGEAMLIDAGVRGASSYVINYLNALNIKELTYVVTTHPHEDHIGGMADVIEAFPVKTVLMPDAVSNSATFERLLNTIDKKGYKITVPKAGESFKLGEAEVTVLSSQDKEYDNLNNYSLVLMAKTGKNKFLFMGDAEKAVENALAASELDLKADVLKTGHHGSSTSTGATFLKKVNPSIAVISCALDNSYGHPHPTVLERLESSRIKIYRTDMQGTIVISSDGENVTAAAK